jgi:hypothetical protein
MLHKRWRSGREKGEKKNEQLPAPNSIGKSANEKFVSMRPPVASKEKKEKKKTINHAKEKRP